MTIMFNPKEIQVHNILIESGTHKGIFAEKMTRQYNHVHTIEIVKEFYNNASEKFADVDNITCHLGNSPDVIRRLMKEIDEPVTFWLDAHYQGGDQPDETEKPLIEELNAIKESPINTHMIMIDDVRIFHRFGTTKEEVEEILLEINPSYTIEYKEGYIENDVLVAYVK